MALRDEPAPVLPLPMFPLGTVLFPHMPLPLHVFEMRYRQLTRDCLRSGLSDRLRYGVVARVNLSSAGDQPSAIRFYLFVPDVVYDVATGGPS
jgi:Lon protease-like protein